MGQRKKRDRSLAPTSKFRTPKTSQRGHSDRKRGPKEDHCWFGVTQGLQCQPHTLRNSSFSCGSTLISSLIVPVMSLASVRPSARLPRTPDVLSKLFFSFVMVSHTVLQNSSLYIWHAVVHSRVVMCWCLPLAWYFVNSLSNAWSC